MLSSSDGKNRHRGRNEIVGDAWAPWMDDRTTTSYRAQHLGYFQGRGQATPQLNPALQFAGVRAPDELTPARWQQSAADSGRGHAATRTGVQPSVKTLHGVPAAPQVAPARRESPVARGRASTERTLSQGWHVAASVPQTMTPGFTLASPLELPQSLPLEDNPFARRSGSAAYWITSLAAGAGLFGAVLLGQVLLRASSEPVPQPKAAASQSVVIAAPASPASEPVTLPAKSASDAAPSSKAPGARSDEPDARERAGGSGVSGSSTRAASDVPDAAPARSARSRSGSSDAVSAGRARSVDAAASEPEPRSTRARVAADSSSNDRARGARARHAVDEDTVTSSSPAPFADAAPAVLRVNSRPWSQVELDGKPVGHTPLFDLRVAPGSHSVRFVNPEFGLSKTIQVKLAAGETITRVELLEP